VQQLLHLVEGEAELRARLMNRSSPTAASG
jgi:hypothetical protein